MYLIAPLSRSRGASCINQSQNKLHALGDIENVLHRLFSFSIFFFFFPLLFLSPLVTFPLERQLLETRARAPLSVLGFEGCRDLLAKEASENRSTTIIRNTRCVLRPRSIVFSKR